jgi:hypothetical protein
VKCISLWQPWASLLAAGKKRVETRGWATRHRGPLLVHAAKLWNDELIALCDTDPFRAALREIGAATDAGLTLPFGAVVGRVDVIDCFPTADVSFHHVNRLSGTRDERGGRKYLIVGPTERAFGDYRPGRFAWLCGNPVPFGRPIPYRGAQTIFEVPDALLAAAGVPG